jgi:hypothetical protein
VGGGCHSASLLAHIVVCLSWKAILPAGFCLLAACLLILSTQACLLVIDSLLPLLFACLLYTACPHICFLAAFLSSYKELHRILVPGLYNRIVNRYGVEIVLEQCSVKL